MKGFINTLSKIFYAHKYWIPNLMNVSDLSVNDLKRIAASSSEAEDKFTKVFSSSPNMVAITSVKDGRFIDINESFTRVTGYTRDDVIGRRTLDLGIWPEPEQRQNVMRSLENNARVYNEEVDFRYKSGAVRICLFSAEIIKISGKACMISVATDITERKDAEDALRASEEFASSLLESSPYPVTVVYPDTTVKYVNPAFERLTGFSAAEVTGVKAPYPWWLEEFKQARTTGLKDFMDGGARITEQTICCKDGKVCRVELNMVRIMHDGEFRYYLSQWTDVTESRRAEAALRESEEKFAKAFRASPDIIAIKSVEDGRFIDANDNFYNVFGYSREDLIGMTATELDMWVDTTERDAMWRILGESGQVSHQEVSLRTKFGEVRHCLLSADKVNISGKSCVLSVVTDITERKRAESALRESEEKYRDLFENTSELIQSVTPDGHFRYVNDGWKKIMGYSDAEIAARTLFEMIHPDHQERCRSLFARLLRGEDIGTVEAVLVAKNGEKVSIEGHVTCKMEDGNPLYTRGIFRDVTKRKNLEENVYRLASAVSMSTDCILITDFDARIIDVNQRTLELFGLSTKQELLGRHFLELIEPGERVAASMDVKTIIEEGKLESREYGMVAGDGRRFVLQMATSLVKDADGQPMGIVRVGREIAVPCGGSVGKRQAVAA